MRIMSLVDKIHTDLNVGNQVPINVKCVHMEKTIVGLCLNASAHVPGVQAKSDASTLATRKQPAIDVEAKGR